MVAVPLRYDPFDASILNDPYPTYRVLRDAAPVYRAQDSHTWVLSRHADVQAAALDHGTYSSVDGIFPTPPGSDFIGSFLPMMIVMDPPRHDQLRALVSRAFTPAGSPDFRPPSRGWRRSCSNASTRGRGRPIS